MDISCFVHIVLLLEVNKAVIIQQIVKGVSSNRVIPKLWNVFKLKPTYTWNTDSYNEQQNF